MIFSKKNMIDDQIKSQLYQILTTLPNSNFTKHSQHHQLLWQICFLHLHVFCLFSCLLKLQCIELITAQKFEMRLMGNGSRLLTTRPNPHIATESPQHNQILSAPANTCNLLLITAQKPRCGWWERFMHIYRTVSRYKMLDRRKFKSAGSASWNVREK